MHTNCHICKNDKLECTCFCWYKSLPVTTLAAVLVCNRLCICLCFDVIQLLEKLYKMAGTNDVITYPYAFGEEDCFDLRVRGGGGGGGESNLILFSFVCPKEKRCQLI